MASASQRIDRKLKLNPNVTRRKIVNFIRNQVKATKTDGVVIGLSGGLDSSLATVLCVEALGTGAVLTVSIPEIGSTDPQDIADARKFAQKLGVEFRITDITTVVKFMRKSLGDFNTDTPLPTANLKPRIRMTVLYYYANLMNRLVVGTGNKSELRAGYFTKYGDGACDIAPLSGLYKTQVFKLAEFLNIPRYITQKPPSAGLWRGQTDENELGLSYEKLDRIYAGLDLGLSKAEIASAANVTPKDVKEFMKREKIVKHKTCLPSAPA